MATFLDVGLFQYFNIIFAVLLIFAIVLALLQKFEILGKNISINIMVAIAIAFMSLMSKTLIQLINFIAPWFVLVFIFLILLLLIYQTLGAKEADIASALKKEKIIIWTVIGVGLIIIFAGFGQVLGQELLEQRTSAPSNVTTVDGGLASGDFESNIYSTLFNPKVLGLIVIFLIAIFAAAFISGTEA